MNLWLSSQSIAIFDKSK